MIIYPAIDIRGGRCVRLVEGDFNRETVFDANPVDAARRWVDAGAEWLHIVDLDGAKTGTPANTEAIAAIRAAVDVPIQLGGGLRTAEAIEAAFGLGIDRAVLGSAVLHDPSLVLQAIERWTDRIAVGLDARDGKLAVDGWATVSDRGALEVAHDLTAHGVDHFIFTDISRDGTLAGPNLVALKQMVDGVSAKVIASGGVGSLKDIEAIRETAAAGVIVGRALYDGRIDLNAAIQATHKIGTSR